ncbi:potassium transporter Trk [Desulfuromonas versatilis]|uniref:Potassium transporter Trk n=1 Tax=Desulfuromonas versatilis TaxID=2802975 RepID=A0ABM8HLN9_9BACT|nr:TrkA family potassium uptake protein [Desulfuromonas versatilis]BCR03002.1 potassium transporter Trk [Desulfuromonas versatilis]
MKRFCVIGLGNFGFHVATTLYSEGHEVVAIDTDRDKVQRVREHSSYAILGDAASKEFLKGQGIDEMDGVVVSTGERSHLSTLITLYLKELKVPRIVVKALDEDHGRILEKVGATEVIYPEKDMAVKTARSLSSPNILDVIPISEDFSITEVGPPRHMVGKTLIQLDLRRRFNVTVIGVKEMLTGNFVTLPPADYMIKDSDLLVLIGKPLDIERACQAK